MQVFEIVVVAVCVVSALVTAVTLVRASRLYDGIGRMGNFGSAPKRSVRTGAGRRRYAPAA